MIENMVSKSANVAEL